MLPQARAQRPIGRGRLVSPSRHTRENGRPPGRLRFDEQLATDQLQAFPHAGEAKSQASIRRRHDIEASTLITNGEVDRVSRATKMDIELTDAAVSHRVVEGLLRHSEEAERHVWR